MKLPMSSIIMALTTEIIWTCECASRSSLVFQDNTIRIAPASNVVEIEVFCPLMSPQA